jgi:hypothetical protein
MTAKTAQKKEPEKLISCPLGENGLFELTAPLQAFRLLLSNRKEVLVHMERDKDSLGIRNMYEHSGLKIKPTGGSKVDIIGEDLTYCKTFFYGRFHLITQLDGAPLKSPKTKLEQVDWIKRHVGLRIEEEVVRSGILACRVPPIEDVIAGDTLDDVLEAVITTTFKVFDQTLQTNVEASLRHKLRELTEIDNKKWRKATSVSDMDTETQEVQRKENHPLIEELYRAITVELEGATYKGEFCTEENKEEWLPVVPYNLMYLVVNRAFQGSQIKN